MPRTPAPAAAPGLPATFHHQPQLRALLILPSIPPGCLTIEIDDEAFTPHLRPGEFAVIDVTDHHPEMGELFLIAYSRGKGCGRKHRVCQTFGEMSRLGPKGWSDDGEGEPTMMWLARHGMWPGHWVESHFTTEHLAEKLVGRVIGVFVPKVGDEREGN